MATKAEEQMVSERYAEVIRAQVLEEMVVRGVG
jgi:hypothetical protein